VSVEPIAIIGMGCRAPGADSPDALWQLLCAGRDVVTAGAYPGGYLTTTEPFAPDAYALTEREATTLDPQHRVLLQTTASALADAGVDPALWAGAGIGVFMGQSTGEHWDGLRTRRPADMYAIAGAAARSMASGRLAYAWDLRGPCATVDAACSSGALAVHLACQSLRAGECDTALAGGVSLVLGTDHTDGYTAARMLSPTGRCRFGDERADGFVRADGCGVVVLKTLSRAASDGDRVHALILASAQASKGRTAKAIIAPSVEGYQQVITRAAAQAGISPGCLNYVEAHGNGVPAGDRIELQAIGAAVGAQREPGWPCLVGSAKTNLGHSEAAAGVLGLIKTALVLRHRYIPASLHCPEPTSAVAWQALNIAPVPHGLDWPTPEPAFAGVNTYGLSGTFVHLLLREAAGR
jgi:3-oxoacyl-[acyl-carrier-protein] synthase II